MPAVYVNRGTVDFEKKDIDWGPPICQHITQPAADSPDKNWITCDNWPTSKGYGTCYDEYDNNGNGNRILMQWTDDSGLTWHPAPNLNTNPAAPGNGNTGDVAERDDAGGSGEPGRHERQGDERQQHRHDARRRCRRGCDEHQGDEHRAVLRARRWRLRRPPATRTSRSPASTNLLPGQTILIDTGAALESRVISTVGTAGASGHGRHAHGGTRRRRTRAARR